ncbi:hypothetical protein HY621_01455 [Candidatus Uhrbacteria bacterium]|nr:hypothetical protein [Candidatus Uhrbacteria bacterium]
MKFALDINGTGLNKAGENIFNTQGNVPQLVGGVLNGLFAVLGLIFLGLMVYGGMLWLLSEGQEKKVNAARGFIFHSVVGLILILAAFAITNFVVGELTKNIIK